MRVFPGSGGEASNVRERQIRGVDIGLATIERLLLFLCHFPITVWVSHSITCLPCTAISKHFTIASQCVSSS